MALTMIPIARMAVLGIASLFSFVTIALAGHLTSFTQEFFVYDFEKLSIAVAVLTIISAPPFLIIGFLRKGSWMTMNVVEVPVLGFLSILWLANGIIYTEWETVFYAGNIQCDSKRLSPAQQTACGEFRAVEALSFITWIALFGYSVGTIILCLIGKSRGNNVWLVDAEAANYFTWNKTAPGVAAGSFTQPQYTGSTVPVQYTGQTVPMQYTGQQPQAQMVYAQPQQVPMQPQMAYSPPPQGHAQV